MTKRTFYKDAPLYLDTLGDAEEEFDAKWLITAETYPAEPTSWGQSRGKEIEVTAILDEWESGISKFTREDAVTSNGEARILDQEEKIAANIGPEDDPSTRQ